MGVEVGTKRRWGWAEDSVRTSLPWHTHGSVLFELGRYRDAVAPTRRALERAADPTLDRASLARILARIGDDGREEAKSLARPVLDSVDARSTVPSEFLTELADVLL